MEKNHVGRTSETFYWDPNECFSLHLEQWTNALSDVLIALQAKPNCRGLVSRCGGGDGVRPKPSQRPPVAMWETQAGSDICVLRGECHCFWPSLLFVPDVGCHWMSGCGQPFIGKMMQSVSPLSTRNSVQLFSSHFFCYTEASRSFSAAPEWQMDQVCPGRSWNSNSTTFNSGWIVNVKDSKTKLIFSFNI